MLDQSKQLTKHDKSSIGIFFANKVEVISIMPISIELGFTITDWLSVCFHPLRTFHSHGMVLNAIVVMFITSGNWAWHNISSWKNGRIKQSPKFLKKKKINLNHPSRYEIRNSSDRVTESKCWCFLKSFHVLEHWRFSIHFPRHMVF